MCNVRKEMTDQVAEIFPGLTILLPTPGTEPFFDRKAAIQTNLILPEMVQRHFYLKISKKLFLCRIYCLHDPLHGLQFHTLEMSPWAFLIPDLGAGPAAQPFDFHHLIREIAGQPGHPAGAVTGQIVIPVVRIHSKCRHGVAPYREHRPPESCRDMHETGIWGDNELGLSYQVGR